ncbi:MAG: hypothetical protein WAO47_01110 [Caldicoprobacterales bacterium]|jgi:hypothetical protein|nr:hypothetical protein [Clostridiales bacterium]
MTDLYSLLKQFNAIGGMAETGQSGFCLLMALWQKANELKWRNKFIMTNAELMYRAGFKSEKTLIEVRNKLAKLGYFKYISPENREKCGIYILEFDLISLMDYLPEESVEVNSEVSNDDNNSYLDILSLNLLFKKLGDILNLSKIFQKNLSSTEGRVAISAKYWINKIFKSYQQNRKGLSYHQCATNLPQLKKQCPWFDYKNYLVQRYAKRKLLI